MSVVMIHDRPIDVNPREDVNTQVMKLADNFELLWGKFQNLNFQQLDTTDQLPEGQNNLYYTDERVADYLRSHVFITPTLIIAGITQGSVLFAGPMGVVFEDNANFFWDDANNRLGIGTNTPGYDLHVAGTSYITGNARFDESLYVNEKAAANADVANYGQIWVYNAAPNQLWFTDDAGNDGPGFGNNIIYDSLGGAAALTFDGATNITCANNVTIGNDCLTTNAVVSNTASEGVYAYGSGNFGDANTEFIRMYHTGAVAAIDCTSTGTGTTTLFSLMIDGVAAIDIQPTTRVVETAGKLNVGFSSGDPSYLLEVYAITDGVPTIASIEQGFSSAGSDAIVQTWTAVGGGDPFFRCFNSAAGGNEFWSHGMDISDSFKWKLCYGSDLTANDYITVTTGGGVTVSGLVSEGNFTIGIGAAGVDYTLTFNGETNDGVLQWLEDEDRFYFQDNVVILDNGYIGSLSDPDAIQIEADGDVVLSQDLTVSGTGPHAFGGAVTNNVQFRITGAYTSGGASVSSAGLAVSSSLTGANGDTLALGSVVFTGDVTTQNNAETIADVYQLRLDEPDITKGATDTITNSATLLITGAASEAVNNFSILVDSGACSFLGTVATGALTVTGAATPNASDGGALGSAALEWSDLFLADGGIIYMGDDQDILLTHNADVGITFSGTGGNKWVIADDANYAPLNITERAAAPAVPAAQDVYLDDGTNTGSGNPGWRRYTGAAWEDVTAAAGGGGAPGGANTNVQYNNAGAFGGNANFTYDGAGAVYALTSFAVGNTGVFIIDGKTVVDTDSGTEINIFGPDNDANGANFNTLIGDNIGTAGNLTGNYNVMIGRNVCRNATSTNNSIYIGNASNTLGINTGANNVGIGSQTFRNNTSGNGCVALSTNALRGNTTGTSCFAMGANTLYNNNTGNHNIGLGISVLFTVTGVHHGNIGIGTEALNLASACDYAVGIGYRALYNPAASNITSTVGIGRESGYGNQGERGTYIGSYSGYTGDGNDNVFLGYEAGYYETGSDTLIIDNEKDTNEAVSRVHALVYGLFQDHASGPALTFNVDTLSINAHTADTDLTINFGGTTNSGLLNWMEDEDYFKFNDDVLIDSTERLYFNDTNTYLTDDGTDLNLITNGVLRFGTYAAIVSETLQGYITVKDAAGNSRKLGVVA